MKLPCVNGSGWKYPRYLVNAPLWYRQIIIVTENYHNWYSYPHPHHAPETMLFLRLPQRQENGWYSNCTPNTIPYEYSIKHHPKHHLFWLFNSSSVWRYVKGITCTSLDTAHSWACLHSHSRGNFPLQINHMSPLSLIPHCISLMTYP